jgi:anti-sigma B factor antagonist
MANPFTVQRATEGDLSIVALDGFLDAHTAPEFEKAIQNEIDGGRFSIIVDCSKLTYISSAGLGVFMGFIDEIREKKGDIKICGLIPKVQQVFEILGFPALFDILDDLPGAVKQFELAPTREA